MKLASLAVNLRFSQKITGIAKVHLSLSQYNLLGKKELTGKNHTKEGRITPYEHLQQLVNAGRMKELEKSFIMDWVFQTTS